MERRASETHDYLVPDYTWYSSKRPDYLVWEHSPVAPIRVPAIARRVGSTRSYIVRYVCFLLYASTVQHHHLAKIDFPAQPVVFVSIHRSTVVPNLRILSNLTSRHSSTNALMRWHLGHTLGTKKSHPDRVELVNLDYWPWEFSIFNF
jgi:hypothetical protein